MRKHQKTFVERSQFPCIVIVHNTLDQPARKPVHRKTNTHLYPPSMFVLIDFCGVRSFGTAADRLAIRRGDQTVLGSVSVVPVCTLPNDNVTRRPALSTAWAAGRSVHLSVTFICNHSHLGNCSRAPE